MQKQNKIPLVCVVGPTASGKTKLSVDIAKALNGEIISADSMQIYKYMNIGTAKPTKEEMCGIPHYCMDFLPPESTFSVADYVKMAHEAIAQVSEKGKLPILTGGTGLYVTSLVDNITFSPSPCSAELRAELKALGDEKGSVFLWEMLNEIDPALAKELHPNNLGRVIRGIEIYRLTGITMTEHKRLSRLNESPYSLCMIGLSFKNRQTLYSRINARADEMQAIGLLDEISSLIKMGYSKTSVQAIGYKEFFEYFSGNITLETAAENVKQETRRYAKRQLTWFNRDERINWLYSDEYNSNELLAAAIELVNKTIGGSGHE